MKTQKILFANFPADGHFNPLTGLAVHLKAQGHDVRWYTSNVYEARISQMDIPFYPVLKALDFSQHNLEIIFPDRKNYKSLVTKLKFDIKNAFILRGPEYLEDIREINNTFDFDVLIADCAFSGIPFVKHLLKKPIVGIGIFPLSESSKDLAPTGLGMTPSPGFWGGIKHSLLRVITDRIMFAESKNIMDRLYLEHGMPLMKGNIFDVLVRECDLLLQSGTPGFEYERSDLGKNIRYIGPLLPVLKRNAEELPFKNLLKKYRKLVLVTQGTVEKDPEKIIVPTLEALKDTDILVVATTGGSGTAELRARFPQANIVIEDYIYFGDIMPFTDVYITNGGYGGVLLSIENKVPLVVAGVHEGKNEITARVGYFKLGINLKTEKPRACQVRSAVEEVLENPVYKNKVRKLSREFSRYQPYRLTDQYLDELLEPRAVGRERFVLDAEG